MIGIKIDVSVVAHITCVKAVRALPVSPDRAGQIRTIAESFGYRFSKSLGSAFERGYRFDCQHNHFYSQDQSALYEREDDALHDALCKSVFHVTRQLIEDYLDGNDLDL